MNFDEFLISISKIKNIPLPALESHYKMVPPFRQELLERQKEAIKKAKRAGVLALFYPDLNNQTHFVLILRKTYKGVHSAQVAFPGGKLEKQDVTEQDAAVRETFEETGLAPDRIEVLGSLPLYVTGTAFLVTPVVALVQPGFVLQPNPHEVDDVFEVPLDFLMDPSNHRRHAVEWAGAMREWYSMPYNEPQADGERERFIWGATAGMLRNFYRLLIA